MSTFLPVLGPVISAVSIPATDFPPIYTASKQVLEAIRGQKLNTGDAIFVLLTFPTSVPLHTLLTNPSPIVVLDDVRNAENIGSILRTAYCLGKPT